MHYVSIKVLNLIEMSNIIRKLLQRFCHISRSASLPRNAHKPAIPPKPRNIAMKMSPTKSDEEPCDDPWNQQPQPMQHHGLPQHQLQPQQHHVPQRRDSQENSNHLYRSGEFLISCLPNPILSLQIRLF